MTEKNKAIEEQEKSDMKQDVVENEAVLDDTDQDADSTVEVAQEEVEEVEKGQWYIVQCYSSQEFKVEQRLQEVIEKMGYANRIFRVLIPQEETVEIKNGKRYERTSKIYPGYVFIRMDLDDEIYLAIKRIAGVAKFIGTKNNPSPVKESEILKVLTKAGDKTKKVDIDFEIEEVIKVVSGPFRGYTGPISEIQPDRGYLKALISIFGRETPVKLQFDQVEKVIE